MCQSLMLTAKATSGQRSAPGRHWLDAAQLKINASCQDGDYSFQVHESHAVKYRHRRLLCLFHETRNEVKMISSSSWCPLTGGLKTTWGGGRRKASAPSSFGSLVTWLMRREQVWWSKPQRFFLKDSWLAALMFDVLCAGMFVMMISPPAQSMLAERLFSTHCMLFHVRIKTACGL